MRLKLFMLAMLLAPSWAEASGPVRWSVGVNIGGPPVVPLYRPYPYYYRPYVYAPAPIIYQPAPVFIQRPVVVEQQVIQQQPAVQQAQPVYASPVAQTSVVPAQGQQAAIDAYLNQLTSADDAARQNAVMELGRMKADRAVDALSATLAGDRNPQVREAAARALGLIASPRSLTALTHAAQADNDRDVRHSAQFAVEIVRANFRQ